jgi:hypothetical protein
MSTEFYSERVMNGDEESLAWTVNITIFISQHHMMIIRVKKCSDSVILTEQFPRF